MQISGFSPSISASFHRPQPQQAGNAAHANANPTAAEVEKTKANNKTETGNKTQTNTEPNNKQNQQLSQTEQKEIQQLQVRDREVRAHEAAHKAAAGSLANGGASFSHQRGPDGKLYAVGGEVSIDTSKVSGDPQATIQKANQIRSAALAPAQPSSQDQSVAAKATIMAAEARKELAAENRAKLETNAPAEKNESSAATEKPAQPDQADSAGARHYQSVANSASEAQPPMFDMMA